MSGTGILSTLATQPAPTFTVAGKVLSSQSAGVGGLRVEVVDKGVGADVSLGQATTDASGNYSLQFPSAGFVARGKTAPDIQVRVFSGQTLLATSDVRYNASAVTSIDVVLPAGASASLPS